MLIFIVVTAERSSICICIEVVSVYWNLESERMTVYDENMNDKKKIRFEELRVVKVLGRGAMGTVLLVVRDGCEDHPFALKLIRKHKSKDKQWLKKSRGIERERDILSSLYHPFLPSLMGEVETDSMVGWAIEYCPGGDLHFLRQIQPDRTFSESAIRFYAAEVVLALEHLHSQGIVYRYLKPENILLQSSGHIMLTDFDLSKRLQPQSNESNTYLLDQQHSRQQTRWWLVLSRMLTSKPQSPCSTIEGSHALTASLRSNSFVGTDEYVAPEIVNGEGHDFSVDWWSLGIFLYEMFYGKTPFKGSNRNETFGKILFMRPTVMGPLTHLHDLILRLLEKNPQKRLGFCNGANEVKSHAFFRGLDWYSIQQLCRPPVVPDFETCLNYPTDHILSSGLQSFVDGITSVSVDASEEEETSDSEIEETF